jgi:D-aminopeptidase
VARGIAKRSEIKPVAASKPVRFEVAFSQPTLALMAEQVPTVERIGADSVAFRIDDYHRGYRFFRVLYKFLQL